MDGESMEHFFFLYGTFLYSSSYLCFLSAQQYANTTFIRGKTFKF